MAFTVQERRAALVAALVCLGYLCFIIVQLSLYSEQELNLGAPGTAAMMFVVSLLICAVLSTIQFYLMSINVAVEKGILPLSCLSYLWTSLSACIGEGALIHFGYFPPTTPLQWHLFVWFWILVVVFALLLLCGIVSKIVTSCGGCVHSCCLCFTYQTRQLFQLFSSYTDPHCPICLDEMIESVDLEGEVPNASLIKTLGCTHSFHRHCIDNWTSHHQSCPVCRMPVEQLPAHFEQEVEPDEVVVEANAAKNHIVI